MVDYKAPGVTAPRVERKDNDNQGIAFAETRKGKHDGWVCFGCRKKDHILKYCTTTSKKEKTEIWNLKNNNFKDDAYGAFSTRTKTKKTTTVINQAVKEETSS